MHVVEPCDIINSIDLAHKNHKNQLRINPDFNWLSSPLMMIHPELMLIKTDMTYNYKLSSINLRAPL